LRDVPFSFSGAVPSDTIRPSPQGAATRGMEMLLPRIARIASMVRQVLSLPAVEIRLWGDERCHQVYRYYTKRHPRYRVISNKGWGVALMPLPPSFDEYLRGRDRQALRTNRKRAFSEGYTFREFSPAERLDEMVEVNRSLPVRQGKPIAASYVEKQQLVSYFAEVPSVFGVFNAEGRLRAYAHVAVCGEVGDVVRLLGHGEDLDHGVMYLLLSEAVRHLIDRKNRLGFPRWVMYDTLLGASPGLRYFKERMGFRPYRVRWTWTPEG